MYVSTFKERSNAVICKKDHLWAGTKCRVKDETLHDRAAIFYAGKTQLLDQSVGYVTEDAMQQT